MSDTFILFRIFLLMFSVGMNYIFLYFIFYKKLKLDKEVNDTALMIILSIVSLIVHFIFEKYYLFFIFEILDKFVS